MSYSMVENNTNYQDHFVFLSSPKAITVPPISALIVCTKEASANNIKILQLRQGDFTRCFVIGRGKD